MAKTRLALVACKTASEGQWTLAKGNEVGVIVRHLGEGERVRLDIETGTSKDSIYFDSSGSFSLLELPKFVRYRVSKEVRQGDAASPTTVEIELNVSPSSQAGYTGHPDVSIGAK